MVGGSAAAAWRRRDWILTWTCCMVVPFAGMRPLSFQLRTATESRDIEQKEVQRPPPDCQPHPDGMPPAWRKDRNPALLSPAIRM